MIRQTGKPFSRPRWASAARRGLVRGFTLIELMITVAIAAVLLSVALPSFDSVVLSTKLSSYSGNLVASTLLARGEAIKRNAVVALCVSSNGSSCGTGGWEQGWLVMCKTTDHSLCDPAGPDTLVIQYQPAAATGWKISEASALSTISFDPSGTGATSATMTVCRATPSVGTQQRTVRISATGRPAVTKTSATTCS
jgi:type IV fimbrial biogenesis protein FimT